ncbi:unnamed protein product [Rotaria socialis]
MFSYSSETLSATDKSRKLCVNKDTWAIFTKFLTMNSEFYEYTRLNIDPHDDLLADQYHIIKQLGNGLTSMIYLLEENENENEYSAEDSPNHVMRILKESEDSYLFSNEIKIIEQLKQFNDSSKFQLFFQDILHPSCPDKYLLYEKELQRIETLSLMHSKQLIDITKYLYDCHIIHRHVRPENLMLDKDTSHIKLIDFTFAITYDVDGKAGSIGVTDTIAYAGHEFLEYYSQLLFGSRLPNYRYERTFDLKCALNVIMALNSFAMNCISALVIIYNTAYIRAKSQEKISFKQNLYKQIAVNKHLLISPFLLIILALPRLIISFLSGCMKSVNDSWFYLMGHFISFIPSMMTFAVFVLPSDMYKKEFKQFIRNLYH